MDDRVKGVLLLVGSMCGLVLYGVFLLGEFSVLLLKLTAFAAVAVFLLITAWVGFSLLTTTPLTDSYVAELRIDEEKENADV